MTGPICKTMIAELICLWSVLLGIATCRPMHETDEHYSEYVIVKRLSGNIQRNKRSSENQFPLKTIFQFKMTDSYVVLDLHLNEHVGRELPVYTISNTGIDLRSTETRENYAVYQDLPSGASVLMKYPPGSRVEEFQLLGEFIHNGSSYSIEPATSFHRNKRDDVTSGYRDRRHVVKRQTIPHDGDFNGDTLVPPGNTSVSPVDLSVMRKGTYAKSVDRTSRCVSDAASDQAFGAGLYAPVTEPASLVLPNEQEAAKNVLPLKVKKQEDKEWHSEHYKLSTPPSTTQSSSSRDKRDAETLYIEYLVVADYRNFQRWQEKVSGSTEEERTNNAFTAMSEFYHYIVNGIDLRFRTATGSGSEIRVIFKSLLVSTEEATSPWIQGNKLGETTVDDAGMLLDFALWRNSVYSYLPEHDHAGLFTGFDLATLYSTSPIGMGYLNSVCNTAWAVSETEENYSATTVHIAAHELGHNLGSQHDGSGNGCSSSALNLMAPRLPFVYNPAVRGNPWTFSTCSQTAIRSYVSGLGSDSCLINKPSYMTESEPGDDGELVPAGLKYSPDQQCNMTYGQDAVLCRENFHGQWDALCYAMQCRKMGSAYCEDRAFPFDRTPCGDKMWCRAGQCVFSEVAPSRHPTCPHGDDPNSFCSTETSCDGTDMRSKDILCCGTCLGVYNTSTTSSTPTPRPTTSVLSVSTSSSTSQSSSHTTTSTSQSTTEAHSTPTFSTLSTAPSSVSSTRSTHSPTSYNVSSPSTTETYSSSSANFSTSTPVNITTSSATSNSPTVTSLTTETSTLSSLYTTTVIDSSSKSSTEPSSSLSTTSISPVTSFSTLSTAQTTSEASSSINNVSSTTVSTFPQNSTLSASVSTLSSSVSNGNVSTDSTTELMSTSITSNNTSTLIPSNTTTVASTSYPSSGNSSTQVSTTNSGTTSSTFPISTSTTSEPAPTHFTLANATSTEVNPTSPLSTTISTSTTVPVSTTSTMKQVPPTEEPKTELSLKLQTLVSLFIAVAIVV